MSLQKKKKTKKIYTLSITETRTALMQMSTINRLGPRFRKSPDLNPPDTTICLEALTTAPQKN